MSNTYVYHYCEHHYLHHHHLMIIMMIPLTTAMAGLYRVKAGDMGTVCLVRVRNPWGDKNEWKGAF